MSGSIRQVGNRWRPRFLGALLTVGALGAALVLAGGAEAQRATSAWWWLTNRQLPAIEATAPPGPQRGKLVIPVAVRAGGTPGAGEAALVAYRIDEGEPRRPPDSTSRAGATVVIDTAQLPDGRHTLLLEAADRSWRRNRASLSLTFTTDNTPPHLTLEATPPGLLAGRPALLRVAADEPAEVRAAAGLLPPQDAPATSGGRPSNLLAALPLQSLLPGGERPSLVAFLAAPIDAPPGALEVRVSARDWAGNEGSASLALPLQTRPAPRQDLIVPEALQPLATGPVAAEEAARLAALTGDVRAERLWHGAFRPPLPAGTPRTTGFGERRDYADGTVVYHAGYDLAAPLGTAVAAAADGVVTFAGQLPQHGSCLILDHGWGIYTVYAHLSRFAVQPGERVTQGQAIGAVGSTGLSTGPHLHWEVRLRGIAIDPDAWLELSAQLAGLLE